MNQLQNMMMVMMNNQNNQNNQNSQNNNNNINNNNNFNNSGNQNVNNNEENNLDDDQLTIDFQRNKKNDVVDFKIKIICKFNDLIKDVLNRYCFKTNEIKENLLFLYNSVNLNDKKFENITVQNAGIINMSRILVIDPRQMDGGKF